MKEMAQQIAEIHWLLSEYQADEDKAWATDRRRKQEGVSR